MNRLLLATLAVLTSFTAQAQTNNLPRGVGIYGYGFRQFAPQTQGYNENGELVPLAEPLQKDFVGPKLLDGVGGAQLRELAKHLQRFDSYSEADNSLLNSLSLGQLDGQVQGNIRAQQFALGFGITDRLTLFTAIPYVQASVQTQIQFSGRNNAQQIKDRLGAAAYQELQDGLDQATQITTNQIKQTIEDQGYAPLDEWTYSGVGDIVLGSIYGFNLKTGYSFLKSSTAIETKLTLPTGYQDDPNILTDVGIGRGYYTLGGKVSQFFTMNERYLFSGSAGIGLNAPTSVERRVPEQEEAIIAQERLTTVELTPGQDFEFTGGVGVRFGVFTLGTTLGRRVHTRDSYSGPIEGNYDILSARSEMSQTYQEFNMNVATIDLFRKGKFAFPFILSAKYHMPIVAKNSIDDRYFEVSLASFFTTPMAAKTLGKKKKRKKRNKRDFARATGLKKYKKNKKKRRKSYYSHH